MCTHSTYSCSVQSCLVVCTCCALPCPALPCTALPCPLPPCPLLPCPALSCPALPCCTFLQLFCLAISHASCPALPYHYLKKLCTCLVEAPRNGVLLSHHGTPSSCLCQPLWSCLEHVSGAHKRHFALSNRDVIGSLCSNVWPDVTQDRDTVMRDKKLNFPRCYFVNTFLFCKLYRCGWTHCTPCIAARTLLCCWHTCVCLCLCLCLSVSLSAFVCVCGCVAAPV